MRKNIAAIIICVIIVALAGCTSGEKKQEDTAAKPAAEKKVEAAEYLTGREAFQRLYVAGRGFAGDIKPFRLESLYTEGAPAQEGKAGIWRAQFASPSRRAIKAYTWSGLSGEDMPDRGISHGTEDDYNPANASTRVFEIAFLKVDSDKAFNEAQRHGGEKLTKKDPKQPVMYMLDWNPKGNDLVWHVIYGTSRNDAKLRVAINATTGAFMNVER